MMIGSEVARKKKGQLDPCHYNFTISDFMLKSMPLSGMIFNVKPNFTELWWHESNFPFMKCHKHAILGLLIYFCEEHYTLLMMQYHAIDIWCALWSLDH